MSCVRECYESWHLHRPGSECHHCDPCELDTPEAAVAAERDRIRQLMLIHGEGWFLIRREWLEPED